MFGTQSITCNFCSANWFKENKDKFQVAINYYVKRNRREFILAQLTSNNEKQLMRKYDMNKDEKLGKNINLRIDDVCTYTAEMQNTHKSDEGVYGCFFRFSKSSSNTFDQSDVKA